MSANAAPCGFHTPCLTPNLPQSPMCLHLGCTLTLTLSLLRCAVLHCPFFYTPAPPAGHDG
jgi:hypothetical protein